MKSGGFVLGASITAGVAFVAACALAVAQFALLIEAAAAR
jgi:hypothetical protein